MTAPQLSVVIAVKGAPANLHEVVERLDCDRRPTVQFCFACAGAAPAALPRTANCESIEGPETALVPELWRDGIHRARADRVALVTTQCIPSQDWIDRLLEADLGAHVGVGGAIDLSLSCAAPQRAVYLLRFSSFSSQRAPGVVADIAADNAVYRTAAIKAHGDLLEEGFWEPSFHRRFAREGLSLKFDPALLVTYRGAEQPSDFRRMRFTHGREYGSSRGKAVTGLRRLGFLAASPLLAPLILGRVVARALPRPPHRQALPTALPWLAIFTVAWSLGETRGYLDALFSAGRPRS